ncbi:hypothetical protein D3C76_1344060 [compost metagenome]
MNDTAHNIRYVFLRRLHEWSVLHKLLQHRLASAIFRPLKSTDSVISSAYIFPICDLACVNIFKLSGGKSGYVVSFVYKKYEGLAADRR